MTLLTNPADGRESPRDDGNLEHAPDILPLVIAEVEDLLIEVRDRATIHHQECLASATAGRFLKNVHWAV